MTEVIVFPLASYLDGQRTSSEQSISDAVESLEFLVNRCTGADLTIWPDEGTTLRVLFEQLVDGAWTERSGFSSSGGIAQDKAGADAQASSFGCALLPGSARMVRATAAVAGGPLRSSGILRLT